MEPLFETSGLKSIKLFKREQFTSAHIFTLLVKRRLILPIVQDFHVSTSVYKLLMQDDVVLYLNHHFNTWKPIWIAFYMNSLSNYLNDFQKWDIPWLVLKGGWRSPRDTYLQPFHWNCRGVPDICFGHYYKLIKKLKADF